MRHRVTFRQFEVFEAIARVGSFTRAAEELHLTQPTVSMQIRRLSETLGLALFEQIGRRVYLTEAGREVLTAAREIFDRLARLEMTVDDMKGLKRGRLRLAVVTTAKYFAPRLLGPFCQRYPGVDVALEVTNRERVLERLVDNLDDLYIIGQPPEDIDVEHRPFLENPLVVLAPTGHPLATRRRITLARLAQEPMLMREPGSGTRMALERLFSEHGLKPRIRMALGSNEAIKQAVMGGLGVSVLSRHTLPQDPDARGITILDVQHFPIARHWYAAWHRGKQLSVVARAFLDYLTQSARGISEETPATPRGKPRRATGDGG